MKYKKVIRSISLLVLLLALTQCRSTRIPTVTEIPIQYREKIVERLVPVQAPADSSVVTAQFRCDSLNRVILKSLSELKGKNVQSGFTFSAGVMKYDFHTSSSLSYARVKDSIIYRDVPVKVTVDKPINYLTWWQKLWVGIGKGAAIFVMIISIAAIVKNLIVMK